MINAIYKIDYDSTVPCLRLEVWQDNELLSNSEVNIEEQINNIDPSIIIDYDNSLIQCYANIVQSLVGEIGNRQLLDDAFANLQLVNRRKFVLDYSISRKDNNV